MHAWRPLDRYTLSTHHFIKPYQTPYNILSTYRINTHISTPIYQPTHLSTHPFHLSTHPYTIHPIQTHPYFYHPPHIFIVHTYTYRAPTHLLPIHLLPIHLLPMYPYITHPCTHSFVVHPYITAQVMVDRLCELLSHSNSDIRTTAGAILLCKHHSLFALPTLPINTSHRIQAHYQPTQSTHSTHPIQAPYHHSLSTHLINPSYPPTHPINHVHVSFHARHLLSDLLGGR